MLDIKLNPPTQKKSHTKATKTTTLQNSFTSRILKKCNGVPELCIVTSETDHVQKTPAKPHQENVKKESTTKELCSEELGRKLYGTLQLDVSKTW